MVMTGVKLEGLDIQNTFTAELPGDSSTQNVPRQVHDSLWSPVSPSAAGSEPSTIAHSPDVCALIGLDPTEAERPEFALIFGGSMALPGGKSYAQVRASGTRSFVCKAACRRREL